MIRKLYLENASGERVDLNGADGIYASEPSGLGMEISPVTGDLGSGFFAEFSSETEPMRPVAFKISFTRADAYEQYQRLADWLSAAGGELLLVYNPTGSAEYRRRCRCTNLVKTEKNRVGWLQVSAQFKCFTPWYRPGSVNAGIEPLHADALRSDVSRYGTGRYSAGHAGAYSADIAPAGQLPAAVRLTWRGQASEPVITLRGLTTGTVYARIVVPVELGSDDTLELFTGSNGSFTMTASGVETDVTTLLDPADDPFFRVPVSETCSLSITGSALNGTADIRIYPYWRTV